MAHSRPAFAALLVPLALLASGCAMFRASQPPPDAPAAPAGSDAFLLTLYPTYDFIPVWRDVRSKALGSEPAH